MLDIQLPISKDFTPDIFAALVRASAGLNFPTLQPSAVSKEDLIDAKIHPENHKDLIVRISGLSAYFIALTPKMQDEIIERTVYHV